MSEQAVLFNNLIEKVSPYLVSCYTNKPLGKYVSMVILRETKSEAVFRTEEPGDILSKESVFETNGENSKVIERVLLTKRKQVAPERRTGRAFLRKHNLLHKVPSKKDSKKDTGEEKVCELNTNNPCGLCIDCFLYGFAVGGTGSQKSRVFTEDSFSILPAEEIIGYRTSNALFENGTMYSSGKTSSALVTIEYVKPCVSFLDIRTLKDVTIDELIYIIGNVLYTKRYGAMTSRIGRMDNEILEIFFSDTEICSSLELVQELYKNLNSSERNHPLHCNIIKNKVKSIMNSWEQFPGINLRLNDSERDMFIQYINHCWFNNQEEFLKRLDESYKDFRKSPSSDTKKSSNNKKNINKSDEEIFEEFNEEEEQEYLEEYLEEEE